jgi:hypothetical protein
MIDEDCYFQNVVDDWPNSQFRVLKLHISTFNNPKMNDEKVVIRPLLV